MKFDIYIDTELIQVVEYENMTEEQVRHDLINNGLYTTKIRFLRSKNDWGARSW